MAWADAALLRSSTTTTATRDPPTEWAIRTPTYMYGELVHTPEVEVYDLTQDPYEPQNVADDPACAAVRAELAACLAQMRAGDRLALADSRTPDSGHRAGDSCIASAATVTSAGGQLSYTAAGDDTLTKDPVDVALECENVS